MMSSDDESRSLCQSVFVTSCHREPVALQRYSTAML